MRILAVVLLVMYHVIGSGSSGGLNLPDSHPLRLFADFFVDLRMPLFAFVAGYVYALKPVPREMLGAFLTGKLRRLALPGITAITVFMAISTVMAIRFAVGNDWWLNYVMPYAHYWFLQAILVIFATYATFDIATRGRFDWAVFVFSACWYLWGLRFPTQVMSVNHAVYLLPYFLAGILCWRYRGHLSSWRRPLIVIAVLAVFLASWTNLSILIETGRWSDDRHDLQSLTFGIAASLLCYLLLPKLKRSSFGPYSFTIYLYHVLATSAARRALEAGGITDLWLHVGLGTMAGIILPIALHHAAMQNPVARLIALGQTSQSLRHKITI